MARLTKAQSATQKKVENLLSQDILSLADRDYIFNSYHEAADNNTTVSGAFFTPLPLAIQFAEHCSFPSLKRPIKILDMCAGIGVLSYAMQQLFNQSPFGEQCEITCIEINSNYVQIGQKVVPEATWIQMDATKIAKLVSLGKFDLVIGNPPFGNVPTFKNKKTISYTGSNAIYTIVELAALITKCASFIIPQKEAGFKYSGENHFETTPNDVLDLFIEQTGILFSPNNFSGTHLYEKQWKAKTPRVEFVECDFSSEIVTAKYNNQPIQCEMFAQIS